MGRKSRLERIPRGVLEDAITQVEGTGMSLDMVAARIGVNRMTLHRYMRRGRIDEDDGRKTIYADFFRRMTAARQKRGASLLMKLVAIAHGVAEDRPRDRETGLPTIDPRQMNAITWLLARWFPDEYSTKVFDGRRDSRQYDVTDEEAEDRSQSLVERTSGIVETAEAYLRKLQATRRDQEDSDAPAT